MFVCIYLSPTIPYVGLVGGLLTGQLLLETTPSAEFNLANEEGSFDLGEFTIFDIIDLPVCDIRNHDGRN